MYGDATAQLFYFSRDYPTEKKPLTSDNFLEIIETSKPIKFFIHGWGESSEKAYFQQLTQEYLINADVQIVQVDWNTLASKPYLQAVENTKIVGGYVGELIIKLKESSTDDFLPLVHIIGHSLGAHAAGHAGKTIRQQTGQVPARITGLDPAGPHFDLVPADRLTANDAVFVDITHTDGNYFGLDEATGHIDFYPNGGHRPQPGCEPFNIEMLQLEPAQLGFCSHIKSYMYFIASINNQSDLATKCDSYDDFKRGACNFNEQTVYGEHVSVDAVGKFYFDVPGHKLHLFEPLTPILNGNLNLSGGIVQNLLKIVH